MLIDDLKFVKGAVGKRDIVPALTHVLIKDGRIRSYNGVVGLGSPIDLHLDCMPKALPFIKAIDNCKEQVTLTLTPTGRLSVHSGRFRALIECSDEKETPHVEPEGDFVEIDGEQLVKALATVEPFIGNDATKIWTNGVLLRGNTACATNNVCLIEYQLDAEFPHAINLPSAAVDEILRIGEAPTQMQVTGNAVTFHFGNDRWLRTQLYSTEWPDLGGILDVSSKPHAIHDSLYEGLAAIKPFADKLGRVFMWRGVIHTHMDKTEGAMYEIEDVGLGGLYRIEMLELLKGVATSVDFSPYPAAAMFFGENIRGAIVGVRV